MSLQVPTSEETSKAAPSTTPSIGQTSSSSSSSSSSQLILDTKGAYYIKKVLTVCFLILFVLSVMKCEGGVYDECITFLFLDSEP